MLVGLYLERSLELMVGLLGVLKAGGAYVPLDPDYPSAQLTFLLQDVRPAAVITHSQLTARELLHGVPVIDLDTDVALLAGYPSSAPANLTQPEHLIYVLYTSGSTGRSKGVANTHRGLGNRLQWMRSTHPLDPADRVLQKTPYSFDASVYEFFWPLITGAQLVFARPGGHRDADYLAHLIAEQKITTIDFVPSMLAVFLEHPDLEVLCTSLKQVFCGGEALLPEHVQRFYARVPHAQLYNHYGPTEASIDVSYYVCPAGRTGATIPIGRPLANTQLYVLDPHLQSVPIGVQGEIHIGGVALARGYLNLPELTAQKFIPDPFSAEPTARLYKTGDLGRFRADGNLEFLGRIDHQVKLRGFRIELGEIEAVLGSHPAVGACAVLLREDSPGDKRLCAYLVLHADTPQDEKSLRQYLAGILPEYMIPGTFVFLSALPLTPSGKLDRRALPHPSEERRKDAYAAPRTSLEQILAELFAQVLQRSPVGIHDDFFALGGHSLLAVRLVAQVAQRTGRALALSTLFQRSTVAALASTLQDNLTLPTSETVLPLHGAGSKPPLFCIHPVGGNVLCYVELARALGPEQPLYGVQAAAAPWPDDAPPETLEAVASRYVAAMTKVQPSGPYHMLGWSLGGVLAFAMAQKLRQANQTVALLALIDSYPPDRPAAPGAEPAMPSEEQLVSWFLRDLMPPRAAAGDASNLSEATTALVARLAQLRDGGLPAPDADPLPRLYAMFRRNLRLLSGHQPGSYPGPVLLLRASEAASTDAPDHGWGAFCTGSLEVLTAPGDHYSLLTPPNVRIVAALLAARLGAPAAPLQAISSRR